MQVEFTAYSGDCRVSGTLELVGERLTDMLNGDAPLIIRDATLEAHEDGRCVSLPELELDRDDLYAVQAAGPRGLHGRRIHTVRHRILVEVGPYAVLGHLHAYPGARPLPSIARRGLMVPLSDATIGYVRGDQPYLEDVSTLLVNRGLAQWVSEAAEGSAFLGGAMPRLDVPV